MTNKFNRAKLSPRYKEALEMFSTPATPQPATPPSEEPPATPPSEGPPVLQPTEEPTAKVPAEEPPTTPPVEDDDSGDWIDKLTPATPPSPPTEEPPPPSEQKVGESDDDYVARLREEFKQLETVDSEVADELFEKAIRPIYERHRADADTKIASLEAQLAQLREHTKGLTETQAVARYNELNKPIYERHPKAKQILRSQEFIDFVNQKGNKYATETPIQILSRAYEAGDVEYVINELDAFVASKSKPKPPVNADGKSSTPPSAKETKKLSQKQFLEQRRLIMSNPRKYPPGALRKLEEQFFNQQ